LGYVQVTAVATFSLGIPAALQTTFMTESAFEKILPSGLPKFRELLDRMDCVECELWGGVDLASVNKVDEIEIRSDRVRTLATYYLIAQQALANLMGIVPNPYDQRAWLQMGGGGINVSVIH
jgi:hypothetical protein